MATYLSSTGKRECGKEWQSEKKALLLLPLGIIVLCSSIVRPALAKISVVRLLLLRSLIRSNIEPNASRPPSAASTAAASFVLVTFYCPWDTKVLGHGVSGHTVHLSRLGTHDGSCSRSSQIGFRRFKTMPKLSKI